MSLTRDGLTFHLVAVDNAGNVIPLAGDANGNLLLGNAGGLIGQVRFQDGSGSTLGSVGSYGNADGQGVLVNALVTFGYSALYNNSSWDRARSASISNLALVSATGAALVTPPGTWAVSSAPAVSTQATATRAALGAGASHIATALDYGYGATTALASASQRLLNLRDGASGAGSVKLQLGFALPAATVLQTNTDALETRCYPGTTATAMTAEWDASQPNLFESVAISGTDAF